jgi:hypothetical protein
VIESPEQLPPEHRFIENGPDQGWSQLSTRIAAMHDR